MYGKAACPFLRGVGVNYEMDGILWHHRESRWKRRKQTLSLVMEDPFLLEKEYEKEKANIVGKRNS